MYIDASADTNLVDQKTFNFIGVSGILHALAFALVLTMAVQQTKKAEPIEIEILSGPLVAVAPNPGKAPVSFENVNPVVKKSSPEKADKNDVVHARSVKTNVPRSTSQKSAAPKSKANVGSPIPSAQDFAAWSQDSDVEVAPLEDVQLDSPKKIAFKKLSDQDLEDGFESVDQETTKSLQKDLSAFDRATSEVLEDNQNQLNQLKAQVASENARMAAAAAQRRVAASLSATKSQQAGIGGDGTGAGSLKGVRQLEDLRQMPGNKRPSYDNEDRFKRREGQVAFVAWVTKDGRLSQIRMIKSSGHETLDSKTLVAIQAWRFQPGQEGWVKIPFAWNLKGGPQEMPATLRRRLTQN